MDTKNIVAEVAIRGNTITQSILYSNAPRWFLVWFFGENAVRCMEEINELCATDEWRKTITTALYK